jgi:DNA-binding NarL/FixJ family response regulator
MVSKPPERSGKVHHNPKILFVSSEADPGIVRAAFSAGGRGYVLKSLASMELIAGMKAVLRGEPFVSRGLKGFE